MHRTVIARRLLLPSALLLGGILFSSFFASCAGGRSGSSGKTPVDPTAGSMGAGGGGSPSDSFPTAAPPFPEVGEASAGLSDSGSLPLSGAGDSALGDSSAQAGAPGTRTGLPGKDSANPVVKPPTSGSRPEGIVQRPRPKELPTHVHVLLSKTAKPLSFYSLGDMQVMGVGATDPATGKTEVTRYGTFKGRFTIRRSGSGFTLEQSRKAALAIPSRKLRLISVNKFNLVDLGGSVYRGGMHLIGAPNGEISAVNVLGVEDYLRGVLPYELGNVDRQALEALKAQAIVARTYAYKRMMRGGNPDFHLYSDVQDQVYKGVRGEYLLSDRAVWETRGMAVTHADTMAICYYFSTCSGQTASKHEVWGGEAIPYLLSRPDVDETGDPFCAASRYSSWTQEWSASQLSGILRRNLRSAGVADIPSFSSLSGIEVTQRASCGRIQVLRLKTDRGPILVKGDKVRWALRPAATEAKILPSAWFDVEMAGGKIKAEGKAFGHGVGLCQFGALGRARAKQNFREIIDAYYYGVSIVEFK